MTQTTPLVPLNKGGIKGGCHCDPEPCPELDSWIDLGEAISNIEILVYYKILTAELGGKNQVFVQVKEIINAKTQR